MLNGYFQQANQLVRQENFEQAIELYKKAIAQNPNIYLYYHNLAEILGKIGKLDRAVEAYQKAIELKPSAAWSNFYLSQILERQNKSKDAIAYYKKAIEINPSLIEVKQQLDNLLSNNDFPEHLLLRSQGKIRKFHNKHKGQRCVIIGNGSSLNQMDLSFLKHEICFGLNKIYLGFERFNFVPNYYVAVNELVIKQSVEAINKITCPKFISNRGIPYFKTYKDDLIFMKTYPYSGDMFSKSPDLAVNEGCTVTYVAMQLAYYMGFNELILIGVDHHFKTQGKPHQEIVSEENDPNHFDPNYFGKGISWNLPDLPNSEKHYKIAKTVFEESGRRIIDATLNGYCQIFTKRDYREIFKEYFAKSQDKTQAKKDLPTITNETTKRIEPETFTPHKEATISKNISNELESSSSYISLPPENIPKEDRQQAIDSYLSILYQQPNLVQVRQKLFNLLSWELKEKDNSLDIKTYAIAAIEQDLINKHPQPYSPLLPSQKKSSEEKNESLEKVLKLYNESWITLYAHKFRNLKHKYKDKNRVFIVNNLNNIDRYNLETLKNEITIFVDSAIESNNLIKDFQPTFYVSENKEYLENKGSIINSCSELTTKLFPISLSYCINLDDNTIFFDDRLAYSYPDYRYFSSDCSLCTYTGVHSIFSALQIAHYLGFKDICLLGFEEEDLQDICVTQTNNYELFQNLTRFFQVNKINVYYDHQSYKFLHPKVLVIDMTPIGHLSATGQVKKKLFAEFPQENILQIEEIFLNKLSLFSLDENNNYQISQQDDSDLKPTQILEICKKFDPDVIYYRPLADRPKLHNFACRLIKEFKIPVVTHIMDDWPFRLKHTDEKAYLFFDTSLRKLFQESAARLSICEAMSQCYEQRYNLDFIPIHNCVNLSDFNYTKSQKQAGNFVIRYIGGIANDMNFLSLGDFIEAINNLPQELSVKLEIYTMKHWLDKAKNAFSKFPCVSINLSNFTDEEYRKLLCNSDALLIAYNFDQKSINYTKYSLANKLPECLASGSPVVIYGSPEVATVGLMKDSDAVKTITERNLEKIKTVIRELVTNSELCQQLGIKGRQFAQQNFNAQQIQQKFYQILHQAALSKSV